MKGGHESKPPANGVKFILCAWLILQTTITIRKEIIMKRVFAIILALALVLTLGAPAFAVEEDGSITITNATVGEKYDLYKIFDATYAVDENNQVILDANGKATISYTITKDNPFFEPMFGKDGKQANDYFNYNDESGVVTKRSGVSDASVINYLDSLAANIEPAHTIIADSKTVTFSPISTGYYLIDRGALSTVTITSNTPSVNVIDKNQKPNVEDGFSKLVLDEDTGNWVKSSSANIGDIIDWKIEFTATNYDGDDIVMYYTIRDTKSSSLWVEFGSIEVTVGTQKLNKGYYFFGGPVGDPADTGEWEYLGNWGTETQDPQNAQWYMIHYGYDQFQIVIPWLNNHTFTFDNKTNEYALTFDLSKDDGNNILSTSIYESPINVKLTYSASVGPDAANTTSTNSAELDWVTPEGTFGPENPQVTETKTYSMGITKTANDGDANTAATRLAGATFELFADEACTKPIHVIPTGAEGVYSLDDVDTVVTGEKRTTARDKYVGAWENYIINDPKPEAAKDAADEVKQKSNRRNDVVTPNDGQLVILGLEAGTYYLLETEAPKGYNKLTEVMAVPVGEGTISVFTKDGVNYSVYNTTVVNNQGVELPSTGGEGTMLMITIGTMVALAFAVLLITHKKMTAYND